MGEGPVHVLPDALDQLVESELLSRTIHPEGLSPFRPSRGGRILPASGRPGQEAQRSHLLTGVDRRAAYDVRMPIRAALLACLALPLAPVAAWPQEPVYKDRERFGPAEPGSPSRAETGAGASRHPARIYTRDPGYAGSDYGLGKPAFTGLGSRPDWGRSGE